MMMYELHVPLVMLSNRCLQRGPTCGVSPDQIKADLKVFYSKKDLGYIQESFGKGSSFVATV